MLDEQMTAYLPKVRCEPLLKQRLERVTENSINPRLSDHIRFAIETYVASEEAKQTQPAPATQHLS